jgi:ribosome maturation factor RimP
MTPIAHVPLAGAVDVARLRALLEPVALSHGVRLCEVEWTTGPGGRVLRVTIERPGALAAAGTQAGVTLEDCVGVSRDASTVLDVEDIIACHYQLEVSSPGLDRPLRTSADFERHVGRLVKLRLHEPAADGQRVLRGTVLQADAAAIRMNVDGNEHLVALGNVAEARPVLDFGGAAKPRASGRSPKKTERAARVGLEPAGAERRGRAPAHPGRTRPAGQKGR